uniref:Uncharacterized protein n=1 Tax=Hyaloperonospora arabidopsidis (strain Emoy2) TaxID=559515 RepID=M4BAN3_HYAAE
MGYKDENRNIVLRYVAFAGSLLFNTKDRWDSTFYEGMLVVCYLLGVVYRRVFTVSNDISPLNRENVVYALCSLAAAAVAAIGFLDLEDKEDHMALGVTNGLMHVLDGAAFYYAWLSVPCVSSKNDEISPTNSVYV